MGGMMEKTISEDKIEKTEPANNQHGAAACFAVRDRDA